MECDEDSPGSQNDGTPPSGSSIRKRKMEQKEKALDSFDIEECANLEMAMKKTRISPFSAGRSVCSNPKLKNTLSGTSGTLHASSLNKPGATVKGIFVDLQNRYLIQNRMSKTTMKGVVTVTYKVKSEQTGVIKKLIVKGRWAELDYLSVGTLVNIVGVQADENDSFIVENSQGYLVVEPDRLISATSIVSLLYCERKSALCSRFYSMSGDNTNTFRGVMAHELICRAMVERILSMDQLRIRSQKMFEKPDMLERAYGIGLNDLEFRRIQEDVCEWVMRFMKQRFCRTSKPDSKYQTFEFMELLGIEDNIWNPTYGLKGKIDATISIQKTSSKDAIVVPLEFKTGSTKPQKRQAVKSEHVGQVSLYTLMMAIKYGSVEDAVLYYISDDSISLHPQRLTELQQLIIMRNRFVRYTTLNEGALSYLPRVEQVEYDHQCRNCDARNMCTLQIKTQHIPRQKRTPVEKLLLANTTLSDEEFDFMDVWLQVINLETQEVEKKYNEKLVWTKTPEEREAIGSCVTQLKLCGAPTSYKNSRGKNGYLVSLVKSGNSEVEIPHVFHVDDFVVLSSNVEVCINYGYIVIIRGNELTLFLEQNLHKEYASSDFTYCVDKVNSNSPISSQYGYLVKLMEDTVDTARLREYIIKKKQPKFEKVQIPTPPIQKILSEVNEEQKRAILKALATDSFLFVKGSPGSGKTTTIVALLRTLVESGKTILVVSYTATALENILMKYKKYSKDFIKISSSRTNKDLDEFSTKTISTQYRTIKDLTQAYNKPMVGTTLLSLKHPIFQARRFDYCIVDEASQALPTAVFGALTLAKKFIIFGDPNQLPPVIQSQFVKSKGIKDNFFSLMATAVNSVKLNIQYRMNKTISDLANQLVYDGQMRCGSDKQKNMYLKLAGEDLRTFMLRKVESKHARKVLCLAVSKALAKSVMFLDTSDVLAEEVKQGDTLSNMMEKDIVVACARLLVGAKLDPKALGVIAPYRGQVALLRNSLKDVHDKFSKVEVNTVDQYQGREMEVIICSFTKSRPKSSPAKNENSDGAIDGKEGILEDMRRLNVAITRARVKLVLIGNRDTLLRFSPFQKLFKLLSDEQIHKLAIQEMDGLSQFANSDYHLAEPMEEPNSAEEELLEI